MSSGIAGFRRYQVGGNVTSSDPDQEERRREIWRMMAAQRGARSPASLPLSRPDTLMGDERWRMMQFLDQFGADTTQINQRGISDYFQSDELGRTLELASQLRGGPPPSMSTYAERSGISGRYSPDTDEVGLNVLLSMIPQHIKDTDLPPWLTSRDLPEMTQERWEQTPADQIRSTVAHEIGHSIPGDFSTNEVFPQSLTRSEQAADNFGSVLAAISNASPDASERDILDSAQRIYWGPHALGAMYSGEEPSFTDRYPWMAGPDDYSGSGGYEDPYIINPSYMESVSGEQRALMRPYLQRILATEQYADHPLRALMEERPDNRGWFSRLREGVGSLFGRERER